MLLANSETQVALEQMLTDWGRTESVAAARRAVAGDGPAEAADLWPRLVELGLLELAVPEEHGGAGGSVPDLAVVLERLGHALVPGSYLPTAAAAVVLAEARPIESVAGVLAGIAGGELRVALATDATLEISGSLRGSGGVVLGAADADLLIVCEQGRQGRCFLIGTKDPGVSVRPRAAIDLARSLAEVDLDGVIARQEMHGLTAGRVRDVLATCLAAEAAGVAGWCVDTAVAYAKVRRQFGRPIGSFQAVKHLCAEMAVLRETAVAAAWDAAACAGDDEQLELAAAAADIALDAALEAAKSCVQVLGGIGYTWEHDAHLYLRRATTVRLVAGSPATARRRLGELVLAGRDRTPPPTLNTRDHAETYERARAFAGRTAALPVEDQRAALAEEGYLVPSWPAPYGRGADPATAQVIAAALADTGVRVPDLVIGSWLVRAIVEHGSHEQRERFVLPTLRGEIDWCQLFSEPEAGSDLASLRTSATRVPGGWRLDGQKVWTSLAREADWGLCLARTDPDAPKHRGISAFVVDMASAGLNIRPLREMSGEARFNEVFLDGVLVPDELVVGTVDDGWSVARATLATERVAMGSREARTPAMSRLIGLLRDDEAARTEWLGELGEILARSCAKAANDRRAALAGLSGAKADALPLVSKLMGVRIIQDEREAVLRAQGAAGAFDDGEHREQVRDFMSGRALSIAGGSTQILLTMLGERVLGLPRG